MQTRVMLTLFAAVGLAANNAFLFYGSWADLFGRKGPRGGTPQTDGCWCQFWRTRGSAYWEGHGDGNRAALEAEVLGGAEPGMLAYLDGIAVGWCRVGPREELPRHRPLIVIPSVALAGDRRCGTDEPADDRLAAVNRGVRRDPLQQIRAFHR